MTELPQNLIYQPGLEAVADAFMGNFESGEEHGASFVAFKNGELLVDLIAGWADKKKTTPLGADHLIAVFSSGKTAAALVIAWLAEQDRLGYDQEVRTIWPEFDTHGKGQMTIAQLLSHQAGLSGITNPEWQPVDWYDWDKTIAELAGQKPIWEPGTACGYHPLTYGFLAGEIARRTDRHSRTLGKILRDEYCDPHDLDIWIGLPDSEHERCADMQRPKALADFGEINDATRAAFLMKGSTTGGGRLAEWRRAEFAGANCHATAHSLARLMSLVTTGMIDGVPYLSEDIRAAMQITRIGGPNLVLPFDIDFAAGFMKNTPNFFFGPTPETLAHSGWGGSCVFADTGTGITGAYTMTRQSNTLLGDIRPRRIIDALYAAL